jgi:hypothetical protein
MVADSSLAQGQARHICFRAMQLLSIIQHPEILCVVVDKVVHKGESSIEIDMLMTTRCVVDVRRFDSDWTSVEPHCYFESVGVAQYLAPRDDQEVVFVAGDREIGWLFDEPVAIPIT